MSNKFTMDLPKDARFICWSERGKNSQRFFSESTQIIYRLVSGRIFCEEWFSLKENSPHGAIGSITFNPLVKKYMLHNWDKSVTKVFDKKLKNMGIKGYKFFKGKLPNGGIGYSLEFTDAADEATVLTSFSDFFNHSETLIFSGSLSYIEWKHVRFRHN